MIVLWDTDTGETIQQQFSRNETPVSTTSFSLDGTAILFNAYATGVTLYDRDLDSTVYSLGNELERPASRAQYDRTGRLVALGRVDSHAIEIYDLSTQSVVLKLKGHTSHVYDLEFSPAGDQLVSLSDDGTARLWDTGSGSEIVREHAGAGRISDVLFSEDGELLLGGVSAGVQIWDSTDFRNPAFWSMNRGWSPWLARMTVERFIRAALMVVFTAGIFHQRLVSICFLPMGIRLSLSR